VPPPPADRAVPWASGEGDPSLGRRIVEGLLVALVALACLWPFRLYGFDLVDEGTLLVQIERAAAGERPYVDFETGYTPIYFLLESALLNVGGVVAVRTAGVLLHAATVAFVWITVRGFGGVLLAAAVAALYTAFLFPVSLRNGAPFNIPYPAWIAAALALRVVCDTAGAAFRGSDPKRRRQYLWGVGLGAGFIFSVKPNAGLLAVAGAALALAATWSRESTIDGAVASVLRFAAPLACVVLFGSALLGAYAPALFLPVVLAAWASRPSELGTGRAVESSLVLAGGFLVVLLLWVVPLLRALGPSEVARNVLLLDGGVIAAYLQPFPWPSASTVLLALGLVAGALAAHRRPDLAPWAVVASLVGGVLAGAFEGARLAAESALLWLGPLALSIGLADRELRADARARSFLVFSAIWSLQLFPRPDLIHVAMGAPPVAVAVALVWQRYAALWRAAASPRARQLVPLAATAVVAALALGRVAPTLGPRLLEPATALALGPRAPLVVLARHADEWRPIEELVAAIRERTDPTETVFAFPDVAGLGFLAERSQPYFHLYFVPGRPDRTGEERALARLREVEPPLVVRCPPHVEAFADAPSYFARLGEELRSGWRTVAEIDGCVVAERRD